MITEEELKAYEEFLRDGWLSKQEAKELIAEVRRLNVALALIEQCGGTEEAHHLRWVIDQVVRILTGEQYEAWIKTMKAGEDGPDTYGWDKGIAP